MNELDVEQLSEYYDRVFVKWTDEFRDFHEYGSRFEDRFESAPPREEPGPKSAKEKLEQAEVADFEVLDESPLALTYAN